MGDCDKWTTLRRLIFRSVGALVEITAFGDQAAYIAGVC